MAFNAVSDLRLVMSVLPLNKNDTIGDTVLIIASTFFIFNAPVSGSMEDVRNVGWGKCALHFFQTLSRHSRNSFLLSRVPSFFRVEKQVWMFDNVSIWSMVVLKKDHHVDTLLHEMHSSHLFLHGLGVASVVSHRDQQNLPWWNWQKDFEAPPPLNQSEIHWHVHSPDTLWRDTENLMLGLRDVSSPHQKRGILQSKSRYVEGELGSLAAWWYPSMQRFLQIVQDGQNLHQGHV